MGMIFQVGSFVLEVDKLGLFVSVSAIAAVGIAVVLGRAFFVNVKVKVSED